MEALKVQKKFTVGSLYAGIGGMCLGFKQAGFNLNWANEWDKNASITYRSNFQHTLIEEDVWDINLNRLIRPDIITAGFPCQPFSIAGLQKGFDEIRGRHFFRILSIVDKLRPKALLLENVKNLLNHNDSKTLKVIIDALVRQGYNVFFKVLNVKDYCNIPQNRERLFIVAFNEDYLLHEKVTYTFPKKVILAKCVEDMLIKEVSEKYFYRDDKKIFPILNNEVTSEGSVYQFRRTYVRRNRSNLCPSLTANMGTGGHNVPLVKTEKGIRKLTPWECLRFQGFPETYKIPEIADCHLYKQAGNAVCVSLVKSIALNIKDVLEKTR